jgi:CRP-like cAMP-binding protein
MILLTLRRTGGYEIEMTHEKIGSILGIRREAASTAIGHLSQRKLVQQGRSRLVVPDLNSLEAEACECYSAICRILGYSRH